jgi:small conductance mechanosensitive channel
MTNHLVNTLLIILIALVVKSVGNSGIVSFISKMTTTRPGLEQRTKTLASILKSLLNIGIFTVALITLLSEWGINVTPIITGAGFISLAVGYGSQALVRDYVTGIFILTENQYNIGDKVKTSGVEGVVKEIKLRTTTLEDADGTLHIIPNSNISIISKYKKHDK